MAGLAQGGRGCEAKRDKSERVGHAGIRDTRGLHPLLCPGGKLMAKSKVCRRNGAQSNGQHACRKVANVGRLELRARGRCRILFVGSCTAEWPKYTRHRRYPWNADGSIAASRESDGSSFAESHDAPSISAAVHERRHNNNRAKTGGRASPVPSARSSQPHSTQRTVPQ